VGALGMGFFFFQNMELEHAVVNAVMKLSVPKSEGKCNVLNTCVNVNVSVLTGTT
jgi:hypothetical protein